MSQGYSCSLRSTFSNSATHSTLTTNSRLRHQPDPSNTLLGPASIASDLEMLTTILIGLLRRVALVHFLLRLCESFFLVAHEFIDFLDVFNILLMIPFTLDQHRKQVHTIPFGGSHGSWILAQGPPQRTVRTKLRPFFYILAPVAQGIQWPTVTIRSTPSNTLSSAGFAAIALSPKIAYWTSRNAQFTNPA